MNYFGIGRPHRHTSTPILPTLNSTGDEFETLGAKILRSLDFGADLGVKMAVSYDAEDVEDVDLLTSPNHDFFDIAEEFGQKVEQTPPPVITPGEE